MRKAPSMLLKRRNWKEAARVKERKRLKDRVIWDRSVAREALELRKLLGFAGGRQYEMYWVQS